MDNLLYHAIVLVCFCMNSKVLNVFLGCVEILIDRKGNVVARFEPTEDMKDVRAAVVEELKSN